MSRKRSSPLGLELVVSVVLALIILPLFSQGAPLQDGYGSDLQHYSEGCYYNYNHYNEGDRILTNEPCLNCTCHNKMLMCYLRVCPFTKPIGHDCVVEKREDQCCPIITCPEVPVELSLHPHSSSEPGTELSVSEKFGCTIDNKLYPEGAQVPSNPNKPCELCYCIKNRTSCLMQECTLHIDGCQPIYPKGSCCPVSYNCDYSNELLEIEDISTTTTVRPTQGFILTTTIRPSMTTECLHNGEVYADGASIKGKSACEHCYCMRGDIVCAVQECEMEMLDSFGKSCHAVPPSEGKCCPSKYICEEYNATSLDREKTTLGIVDEGKETTTPQTKLPSSVSVSEDDVLLQQHIDFEHEKADSTEAPKNIADSQPENHTVSGNYSTIADHMEHNTFATPFESVATDVNKDLFEGEPAPAENNTSLVIHSDTMMTTSTLVHSDTENKKDSSSLSDSYEDDKKNVSSEEDKDSTEEEKDSADKKDEHKKKIPSIDGSSAEEIDSLKVEEPAENIEFNKNRFTIIPSSQDNDFTAYTTYSPHIELITEDVKQKILPEVGNHKVEEQPIDNSDRSHTRETNIEFDKDTTYSTGTSPAPFRPELFIEEHAKIDDNFYTTEYNAASIGHAEVYETGTESPNVLLEHSTIATTEQNETEVDQLTTSKTDPSYQEDYSAKQTSDNPAYDIVSSPSSTSATEMLKKTYGVNPNPTTDMDVNYQTTFNPMNESIHNFDTNNDEITTKNYDEEQSSLQPTEEENILIKDSSVELDYQPNQHNMDDYSSTISSYIGGGITDAVSLNVFSYTKEDTQTTVKPFQSEHEFLEGSGFHEFIDGHEPIPSAIPGEGECLFNNLTYKNNSIVPTSEKCEVSCSCLSSIVVCKQVECEKPQNIENCILDKFSAVSCCPSYICGIDDIPSKIDDEKSTEVRVEVDVTTQPTAQITDFKFSTKSQEKDDNLEPSATTIKSTEVNHPESIDKLLVNNQSNHLPLDVVLPTVLTQEPMSHIREEESSTHTLLTSENAETQTNQQNELLLNKHDEESLTTNISASDEEEKVNHPVATTSVEDFTKETLPYTLVTPVTERYLGAPTVTPAANNKYDVDETVAFSLTTIAGEKSTDLPSISEEKDFSDITLDNTVAPGVEAAPYDITLISTQTLNPVTENEASTNTVPSTSEYFKSESFELAVSSDIENSTPSVSSIPEQNSNEGILAISELDSIAHTITPISEKYPSQNSVTQSLTPAKEEKLSAHTISITSDVFNEDTLEALTSEPQLSNEQISSTHTTASITEEDQEQPVVSTDQEEPSTHSASTISDIGLNEGSSENLLPLDAKDESSTHIFDFTFTEEPLKHTASSEPGKKTIIQPSSSSSDEDFGDVTLTYTLASIEEEDGVEKTTALSHERNLTKETSSHTVLPFENKEQTDSPISFSKSKSNVNLIHTTARGAEENLLLQTVFSDETFPHTVAPIVEKEPVQAIGLISSDKHNILNTVDSNTEYELIEQTESPKSNNQNSTEILVHTIATMFGKEPSIIGDSNEVDLNPNGDTTAIASPEEETHTFQNVSPEQTTARNIGLILHEKNDKEQPLVPSLNLPAGEELVSQTSFPSHIKEFSTETHALMPYLDKEPNIIISQTFGLIPHKNDYNETVLSNVHLAVGKEPIHQAADYTTLAPVSDEVSTFQDNNNFDKTLAPVVDSIAVEETFERTTAPTFMEDNTADTFAATLAPQSEEPMVITVVPTSFALKTTVAKEKPDSQTPALSDENTSEVSASPIASEEINNKIISEKKDEDTQQEQFKQHIASATKEKPLAHTTVSVFAKDSTEEYLTESVNLVSEINVNEEKFTHTVEPVLIEELSIITVTPAETFIKDATAQTLTPQPGVETIDIDIEESLLPTVDLGGDESDSPTTLPTSQKNVSAVNHTPIAEEVSLDQPTDPNTKKDPIQITLAQTAVAITEIENSSSTEGPYSQDKHDFENLAKLETSFAGQETFSHTAEPVLYDKDISAHTIEPLTETTAQTYVAVKTDESSKQTSIPMYYGVRHETLEPKPFDHTFVPSLDKDLSEETSAYTLSAVEETTVHDISTVSEKSNEHVLVQISFDKHDIEEPLEHSISPATEIITDGPTLFEESSTEENFANTAKPISEEELMTQTIAPTKDVQILHTVTATPDKDSSEEEVLHTTPIIGMVSSNHINVSATEEKYDEETPINTANSITEEVSVNETLPPTLFEGSSGSINHVAASVTNENHSIQTTTSSSIDNSIDKTLTQTIATDEKTSNHEIDISEVNLEPTLALDDKDEISSLTVAPITDANDIDKPLSETIPPTSHESVFPDELYAHKPQTHSVILTVGEDQPAVSILVDDLTEKPLSNIMAPAAGERVILPIFYPVTHDEPGSQEILSQTVATTSEEMSVKETSIETIAPVTEKDEHNSSTVSLISHDKHDTEKPLTHNISLAIGDDPISQTTISPLIEYYSNEIIASTVAPTADEESRTQTITSELGYEEVSSQTVYPVETKKPSAETTYKLPETLILAHDESSKTEKASMGQTELPIINEELLTTETTSAESLDTMVIINTSESPNSGQTQQISELVTDRIEEFKTEIPYKVDDDIKHDSDKTSAYEINKAGLPSTHTETPSETHAETSTVDNESTKKTYEPKDEITKKTEAIIVSQVTGETNLPIHKNEQKENVHEMTVTDQTIKEEEKYTTKHPLYPHFETTTNSSIAAPDKIDYADKFTTTEEVIKAQQPQPSTTKPSIIADDKTNYADKFITTEGFIKAQHQQPSTTEIMVTSSTIESVTSASHSNYAPPSMPIAPPQYPSYSEDEYTDEEETEVFGPGTCRYGGKLFVSAQQIPRDDPCDFCFCFRSDIICLQQSCPPPISGCHEEPISGFCCPRYECPVSMATVLNLTTSTTTTSTTLPPHFLHHAYQGSAERNGCHIKGKSYRVGDKIDAASGPCMHCTCGGDGQMKCDPKTCSPEPMLREMIAAVASRRR